MRNYYGKVVFGWYREDYDFGDGYWATIEECPEDSRLHDIWIHHTAYGVKMLAIGGIPLHEAQDFMCMGALGIYFTIYEEKYMTRDAKL